MVVICYRDIYKPCLMSIFGLKFTKTASNLKAIDIFEIVSNVIMKYTTSWMEQAWLFDSKHYFLILFTTIIKIVVGVIYTDLAK